MSMTWEDVIRDINISIELLQTFIAEDPSNRTSYERKLSFMQISKQTAINQQNRTIQATLDKMEHK